MTYRYEQDNLLGHSNSFLEVLEQVSQIAPLTKPVLIIGERGTGKELIAARLHYLSSRWQQSYLKLNCAALNDNLLESELFGHDSGAFTGANKRHLGRFEKANNGTLFLDEIANTSNLTQEKLLRVVEYGEFERVGGSQTIKSDVRIIAATNEDLPSLAEQGLFRADLLDRLAFDVITLPPLRARKDDILLLAEHFAINMAQELSFDVFNGFTEQATNRLLSYAWPGNIRELKNVVERSVYRHNAPDLPVHELIIDPFNSPYRPQVKQQSIATDLSKSVSVIEPTVQPIIPLETPVTTRQQKNTPNSLKTSNNPIDFPVSLKALSQSFEIELIKSALASNQFNQKKTAQSLKLTYHQLRGYLKKYHLLDDNVVEGSDNEHA